MLWLQLYGEAAPEEEQKPAAAIPTQALPAPEESAHAPYPPLPTESTHPQGADH